MNETSRFRKTKLYLNPMWPQLATNIAQYEMKSHHWALCHIDYTHGPIIQVIAFWWFQNAVSIRKDICSVYVLFTGLLVFTELMAWRLTLRTCYIGHLKYTPTGKKRGEKKRIEFFFFLKQLKVKYKIKTILILMKHLSSTVVNNFVIDAKSKVCFKTLRWPSSAFVCKYTRQTNHEPVSEM